MASRTAIVETREVTTTSVPGRVASLRYRPTASNITILTNSACNMNETFYVQYFSFVVAIVIQFVKVFYD